MNMTIAKVIAFELGVLIAILTWIAFYGLPGTKPKEVATARAPTDESLATVSPIFRPTQQRVAPVDYPADDLQVAQMQTTEPSDTVQTYDQGTVTGGYAGPGVETYYPPAEDPANSIGIFPEPVLTSPDCYLSPYGDAYAYYQPAQIIVVSNNRSFGRRGQSLRRAGGGRLMSAHRLPMRVAPRAQSNRVMPHANAVAYGRVTRPRVPLGAGVGRTAPRQGVPMQRSRPAQLIR
jgi:hypothetical protein